MGLKVTHIEMLYEEIGGHHVLTFDEKWLLTKVKQLRLQRILEKTTICAIQLDNNFEIVGKSHCEKREDFSEHLGNLYALKDALGQLAGYLAFYRHGEVELT